MKKIPITHFSQWYFIFRCYVPNVSLFRIVSGYFVCKGSINNYLAIDQQFCLPEIHYLYLKIYMRMFWGKIKPFHINKSYVLWSLPRWRHFWDRSYRQKTSRIVCTRPIYLIIFLLHNAVWHSREFIVDDVTNKATQRCCCVFCSHIFIY